MWDLNGKAGRLKRANLGPECTADRGPSKLWPRVYLLGVAKAGSTALSTSLFGHPRLCKSSRAAGAPAFMDKEVHFFDKQYRKGSKYYLERFRTSSDCQKKGIFKKGNNVTGVDATPGYIGKPKSLVMMKKMIPECIHKDLRFILVLREPLSRDLSWFNHLRQRNEPKSQKKENQKQYERYLERNIKSYPSTSDKNILYRGRYVEQLEQFWRLFPRNQTLVFSYETLVDHYADSLRRVAEFLKIDEGPLLKGENEEQNAREFGGKLSVSDLPKELCEQGRKFFEESNRLTTNRHVFFLCFFFYAFPPLFSPLISPQFVVFLVLFFEASKLFEESNTLTTIRRFFSFSFLYFFHALVPFLCPLQAFRGAHKVVHKHRNESPETNITPSPPPFFSHRF